MDRDIEHTVVAHFESRVRTLEMVHGFVLMALIVGNDGAAPTMIQYVP